MTLSEFISDYGYLAVIGGCFIEGELAIIFGTVAAVGGYLQMPGIMVAAFFGTVAADNVWFWTGRRLGRPFLLRRRGWRDKAQWAEHLAVRHGTVTMLSLRFLYGLRTVTPFVLGAARVHPLKFLLLEAISTFAWVSLVSWLAWPLVSATMNAADSDTAEWQVIGAVLAVAAVIWMPYFLYARLRDRGQR